MEALFQALYDAGFHVHINPGVIDNGEEVKPEGVTVLILTKRHMMTGIREERWDGYGATVREALDAACTQLQQHMRPAYDSYLMMAEAFGWER